MKIVIGLVIVVVLAPRRRLSFGQEEAMTLSIQLPDDAERQLREAAQRLNVPVDQLAAAAVRDFVTQPAGDFEDAARRVLAKNGELYRRLA